MNAFQATLGMNRDILEELRALAAKDKAVTLRITTEETCNFLHSSTREETSPQVLEVEEKRGSKSKTTSHKVVSTITEQFYSVTVTYSLEAFTYTHPNDSLILTTR